MASHRSPGGRRARRDTGPVRPRHLTAGGPVPHGPSLRTTMLVSAVAVGSVATGTFTALLPGPSGGAAAGGGPPTPTAATTAAGWSGPATTGAETSALRLSAGGHVSPVAFVTDTVTEGVATADDHLARLGKATDLAAALAEQNAQAERERAERDRVAAAIDEGGVDGWIAEALEAMDMPQSLAPGVEKIIMAESGGNPRAINRWDSNARRGTPSQGLMQTIPSTFRAYVHPDYADRGITDPVANITAGVRYMVATYGTNTLQAGGRTDRDGSYVGY